MIHFGTSGLEKKEENNSKIYMSAFRTRKETFMKLYIGLDRHRRVEAGTGLYKETSIIS